MSAEAKDGTDQPLRRDVRALGMELGQVLREHAGRELYDLVERVRALAKRRRGAESGGGDADAAEAEAELRSLIAGLEGEQLRPLILALSRFFDLSNLAEDRHRVRVLRERERERHPHPRSQSIGAAVLALKEAGHSAEEVQALLDRLHIEPVFTAHPTEAKRRTVRKLIRRLREGLTSLDDTGLLPRERSRLIGEIRAHLAALWATEPLRPRKPEVLEEVRRSLFVVDSLWEVIPQLMLNLKRALAETYADHDFRVRPPFSFGSWIGGDRDGNPFVTDRVTAETLALLRHQAVRLHLREVIQLDSLLTLSDEYAAINEPLRTAIARAIAEDDELAGRVEALNPHEMYRHWLAAVRLRLERTSQDAELGGDGGRIEGSLSPYRSAAELEADLLLIDASLRDSGYAALAEADLAEWLERVRVFGLHVARLDVREDSRMLHRVVGRLAAIAGLRDDYEGLDEAGKVAFLSQSPGDAAVQRLIAADEEALGEDAAKTLRLFRLLHRQSLDHGPETLGCLIVSMTHHPSDVLTMLWLSRVGSAVEAAATQQHDAEPLALPIVPLFETIDDLHRSGDMLRTMLGVDAYRQHVHDACDGLQVCMIGYSDSTKDGGYLSANWHLFICQRSLARAAAELGVDLMLFHGRGGSLGRGGGPAARGILSLPPAAVGGRLRLTEQGEVLAERYDDPEIALRHLEEITWATMLVSMRAEASQVPDAWLAVLEEASKASEAAYRGLIADPAFLPYFSRATPIDTIESLPIGSRPSRRKAGSSPDGSAPKRSLSDLRAIPYTFAWTQNRHLLTGFHGLGTGLEAAGGDGSDRWATFGRMYGDWPMFRAIIDNAELALAKADPAIGHAYAELVEAEGGLELWERFREEHERSRAAVLAITGRTELLEHVPWLQRSIRVRNPYVDPLNMIQVELMKRRASMAETLDADTSTPESESLEELLRLSVQGVAAGMRTTG